MAYDKLTDQRLGEMSEKVWNRFETARQKQRQCFLHTGLADSAMIQPAHLAKAPHLRPAQAAA